VLVRVILLSAVTECLAGSSTFDCPASVKVAFNSSLVTIDPYVPPTTSSTSVITTSTTAPVLEASTTPGPEGECGDGVVTSVEACDDGNTADYDGCSSTCTVECGYNCSAAEPNMCTTTCGDSVKAGIEVCDDGGAAGGCEDDCNGVQTGWQCTDEVCGGSSCSEVCGDSVQTVGEACEDGNTNDGDGCSATCTIECGYSCSAAEPNVCTTTCGDSVKAGDEKCDDGNTVDGDGCSADCSAVEDTWQCSQSSPCGGSTCASTLEEVLLALQLPYTISEFDDAKQYDFKAAMAIAASTTPDRVFIQKITTVASTSRRLLSGSIQVDVSIAADSPSAAIVIATQLRCLSLIPLAL